MKRLSTIFMILTLVVVSLFFVYKWHMATQFNQALEDSKALTKGSLILKKPALYSNEKGKSYIFSAGDKASPVHQEMLKRATIYHETNPLDETEFSVMVPEVRDTGLKGVQKILYHYRRYKTGSVTVDKVDEKLLRSYHIKADESPFTLDELVKHYAARVNEEIVKTLNAQAIANTDEILASLTVDQPMEQFQKESFLSDYVDYQAESMLFHSDLLSTPIKVPYASVFDVIDSQYLKETSLEAYHRFEAEEKARKEAEEAARIEEERLRQLSAFDYGPVLQGERVVALTFDDGPNPATTPQVLDVLARYNAKATFYVIGSAIEGNASILKRMVQEGHEIGNHTWNHPKLPTLSPDQIAWQFQMTTDAIQVVAGVIPKTFRPPYGATNDIVKSTANLTQILWTVDTLDWQNRSTEGIMANIKVNVQPGGVILMHDIHPTTLNALPTVMDYLVSEGYRFVTISELYGLN